MLSGMRRAAVLVGIASLVACAHAPARPAAGPDRVAMREFPARDPAERGLLIGSVRAKDGPLAGATLIVDGTDRYGIAEGEGTFRTEAVPAGAHKVTVYWDDETHELGLRTFGPGVLRLDAALTVKPGSGIIVEHCQDWGNCNAPMVDTTTTQQGVTIDHDQMTKLPN